MPLHPFVRFEGMIFLCPFRACVVRKQVTEGWVHVMKMTPQQIEIEHFTEFVSFSRVMQLRRCGLLRRMTSMADLTEMLVQTQYSKITGCLEDATHYGFIKSWADFYIPAENK
jgi:hypothetical protein